MKHRYANLSSFLLLLATSVQAQTITDSESPIAGDSFVDNYAPYMAPGPGGSGQTWDFSSLVSDSSRTVSFQTPASTGVNGGFPDANIAETTDMTDWTFFESSSAGYDLHGVYLNSLAQEVVYQDPERVLKLPCSMNTAWNDSLGADFTSFGLPIVRSGVIDGLADGSGTLVMPYGTVNNVLRVRTIEDYTDYTLVAIDYLFTTYFYYKPGVRHPILTIFHQEVTTFGTTTTSEFIIWMSQTPGAIEDLTGDVIGMELYPNPASDHVVLSYGGQGEALDLEVTDVSGRVVRTERLPAQPLGFQVHDLDLPGLVKGVYQVRLTAANGRQGMQRLVVR
ncbi:MAG: T9SS type A sorting domain-containing protein [Flavobacteriales bacterium]|nr:T9SS type A sorting domain-containing protein [Flavobacteriales bacterium]MCB9168135.1 T9SS type A sorting domain-containing protein [Flavobacteriales bacterium]MCB9194300.1 T9SS type A sorting domain-containing protein [Flavobacteriales bacterium]